MIEGTKIAHVTLAMFGEKTSFEFLKTYADLKKEGAQVLILDLRDNGGGLLETSVNILSNFFPRDRLIVTTKEKNPFMNHSYFSYGPGDIDMPVVLLVNENSASASEITAGAMKDYERAIIVGTKTYGKGSVQQPFFLSDGSELKITVAKWYTPLDHGIDKVGIEPDVSVKFEKEDFDNRYDRQLEEAKKIAARLLKTDRKTVLAEYAKFAEDSRKQEKDAVTSGTGNTEASKK
ncbi:MAG: carboxyl-terminal processing protease [Patescibacteria group bacterium]|nr:carboxyl-terminal processing protease [Patescibacteria group bacterium]